MLHPLISAGLLKVMDRAAASRRLLNDLTSDFKQLTDFCVSVLIESRER